MSALSSRAVWGNGGVVLGHGKPIWQVHMASPYGKPTCMFQGLGATPNLYSMQTEHPSPTQNSAMRCLWCVHGWHVTGWKALSVEHVGNFSSGPARVVGEIAFDQSGQTILQGYIRELLD
jgi:hypothetical protein